MKLSYKSHSTGRLDKGSKHSIREAVGLFNNMSDLQEAVKDLEIKGFPREWISVMGSRREIEQVFGMPAVPPEIAEDDPRTPRQSPTRPEEKAIGAGVLIGGSAYVGVAAAAMATGGISMAAMLPAVIIAGLGGGVIGVILTQLLGKYFDKNIEEQINKGGLLLWVRTPDATHERMASRILKAHGAKHVKMHDISY
jgi:hypothetical protein